MYAEYGIRASLRLLGQRLDKQNPHVDGWKQFSSGPGGLGKLRDFLRVAPIPDDPETCFGAKARILRSSAADWDLGPEGGEAARALQLYCHFFLLKQGALKTIVSFTVMRP